MIVNYRKDRYGNELSVLGYGCMRFPKKAGKIDMAAAEKLICSAVEQGVNYFDTAYIYAGSEATIGEIFEKNNLRHRVKIATKLPHYLIKNREGLDNLFAEELRRLRTDYVDYYLMHMLNDVDSWQRLLDLGIAQWIEEKKASGAIRQVGFSYHGNTDMFCKLLDAYDWDFCQVQYNYLDEHAQAGRRGVTYAHSKGIPVIIMEPLRGGRLVDMLPEKAKKIIADYPVKRSAAEWGLRWLWDQKEVTVVLSGMGQDAMLQENIAIAASSYVGQIPQEERTLYTSVIDAINETVKVGCTACGYCQPCPKGVDIPGIFAAYNRWYGEGKIDAMGDYLKCTVLRKNPTGAGNCTGCGKCEKHCPQNIAIRKELKAAQKVLENPVCRVFAKAVTWFVKF